MKYHVNLLSVKKASTLDRVIYFALNYLRYILVITQIIVIGVFLYKLKVDQEIIDYQESVDQKKEIVTISQPLVKEAKIVSFKISEATKVVLDQDSFLAHLQYVNKTFPKDLLLTRLNYSDKQIKLLGHTENIDIIRIYLNRLRKDKKFSSVELTTLQKSPLGIEFTYQLVWDNKVALK